MECLSSQPRLEAGSTRETGLLRDLSDYRLEPQILSSRGSSLGSAGCAAPATPEQRGPCVDSPGRRSPSPTSRLGASTKGRPSISAASGGSPPDVRMVPIEVRPESPAEPQADTRPYPARPSAAALSRQPRFRDEAPGYPRTRQSSSCTGSAGARIYRRKCGHRFREHGAPRIRRSLRARLSRRRSAPESA